MCFQLRRQTPSSSGGVQAEDRAANKWQTSLLCPPSSGFLPLHPKSVTVLTGATTPCGQIAVVCNVSLRKDNFSPLLVLTS